MRFPTICLSLLAVAGFSVKPSLPSSEPTLPQVSKALREREATIQRKSLELLRDGIAANIRKVVPGSRDLDLIAADLYAHHRIIGVGEASHGTSEIFIMRAELLKSLAKLGLRSLVIELNMPGAEYLDDYVCGKVKGNPSMLEVMKSGGLSWVWQTPEVAGMLGWIHDFNAKHSEDPIRIYGVDGQYSSANRLLDLLEAKHPGFDAKGAKSRDESFAKGVGEFTSSLYPEFKGTPGPEFDKLFADRQQFVAELRTAINAISLGARERKVAELELRSLEQGCSLFREDFLAAMKTFRTLPEIMEFTGPDTMRDKYMAENFAFIDRYLLGIGARIMVWAHIGHLARRPVIDLDTNSTHLPLGTYLAQWYGDKYHVMNITIGGGTVRAVDASSPGSEDGPKAIPFKVKPNSMEWLISTSGVKGTLLLETSRLPMRHLRIDYLAIGGDLEAKELSGLARGTVADFDSFLFIPTGKASTQLQP